MEVDKLTRRQMLGALGAGVVTVSGLRSWLPALASERSRMPNVVLILADDLGWRDTSLYGSRFYETPNIERLANRGMLFTQAYAANPLCSPTRASIMTGLHPARIGITTPSCHLPQEVLEQRIAAVGPPQQRTLQANSVTRLKQEYVTIAERLKEAGYATGHFGKWHLGHEPYDPLHQGFAVDVPHTPGPGPGADYLAPWSYQLQGGARPGDAVQRMTGETGEHIEDRMGSEAVKFIRDNKHRPFFLNYWCFSVHGPWKARPELIEKYRKKANANYPQHNPVYGAMIESMDQNIGRVIDEIDRQGLSDNTIIILFSDNGGVHFEDNDGNQVTSNFPLRGGKATIYEGGTRVPCVVVWPGTVQPGSHSSEIIQSIDWHPTILEMLQMRSRRRSRFDGMSIAPALKGKRIDRDTIFCHFPHYVKKTEAVPSTYVRKGDWKLIRFYCDTDEQADRFELYNLKTDISERRNVARLEPDRVNELNTLIDGFLKDTSAMIPQPNPDFVPEAIKQ